MTTARKRYIQRQIFKELAYEIVNAGEEYSSDSIESVLDGHEYTLQWLDVPSLAEAERLLQIEINIVLMHKQFPVSEMEMKPASGAVDEAIGFMKDTRDRLKAQEDCDP